MEFQPTNKKLLELGPSYEMKNYKTIDFAIRLCILVGLAVWFTFLSAINSPKNKASFKFSFELTFLNGYIFCRELLNFLCTDVTL